MGYYWTDSEKQFLKDNFLKMDDEEIGCRITRSPNAVAIQRHLLGLRRRDYSDKIKSDMHFEKYTFPEIKSISYKSNGKHLILNFETYEDLLSDLFKLAEENFRTPEDEIFALISEAAKNAKLIKIALSKGAD